MSNTNEIITKYTGLTTVQTTCKDISLMLINNEPQLTQSQMAEVVQLVKDAHGDPNCKTSSKCIAYYKTQQKKAGPGSQVKFEFRKEFHKLSDKEQKKILLALADKHFDALIKAASIEDLTIETKESINN